MLRFAAVPIALLTVVSAHAADKSHPKSLDPELKIELFAEHPTIVTPTGIDVDYKGRVFAVESNTHFRPKDYKGHKSDRVLVLEDTNGDGKADKTTVFTDGLTHTMSVKVRPLWLGARGQKSEVRGQKKRQGEPRGVSPRRASNKNTLSVYVATRRDIFLYHDTNNDLKADRRQSIIKLVTKGNYPHNGLAGITFDAMGWMYFGFGENLGAKYTIVGSDGKKLSGGGEGGNVYRCRPDGSKLSLWATGFWNPHASCVDAFGRLFTVDNDPDSRPPCRLLHIIEGGDYGFRFRNGRKGLHPFTAWNGEIPGTLPMVAGTGEAPSGIVAYESDGFPKKYIGNLLVGSWGDHRIDRFVLKPKGASFESRAEPFIQGGEDFRPVGLAVAPDGSLFCTDWVKRDYKLHGHGRVWRISKKQKGERGGVSPPVDLSMITAKRPVKELEKLLSHSRMDVRRTAAATLERNASESLLKILGDKSAIARSQVESIWAFARRPEKRVEPNLFLPRHEKSPMRLVGGQKIFPRHIETLIAALNVLGTPQFSLKDQTFTPGFGLLKPNAGPSPWEGSKGDHSNLARAVAAALRPAFLLNQGPNVAGPKNYHLNPLVTDDSFLFSIYIRLLIDGKAPKTDWSTLRKQLKDSNLSEYLIKHGRLNTQPIPSETSRLKRQEYLRVNFLINSQIAAALALRRRSPSDEKFVTAALKNGIPEVKRIAVQWAAEENLKQLKPQVEAVLNGKVMNAELFLATLAALEMLDGKSPKDFDKTPAGKYVLPLVKDAKRSPAVRAQALRLVDPDDKRLEEQLFRELLGAKDATLKLEAVRTLAMSSREVAQKLLAEVARNDRHSKQMRAEALTGLTYVTRHGQKALTSSDYGDLSVDWIRAWPVKTPKGTTGDLHALLVKATNIKLQTLAMQKKNWFERDHKLRAQIERFVRHRTQTGRSVSSAFAPVVKARPKTAAGWYSAAKPQAGKGDAKAGRRVFFHRNSAGCYKCHTVNGRGGKIGPDLSYIARTASRKKLAESILEPSKEIAPQYTLWSFVMADGKVHHGMILGDTRNGKRQRIGTAEGKTIDLPLTQIELRKPQKKSLMPEKLIDQLTATEFRDLLAYLESLK